MIFVEIMESSPKFTCISEVNSNGLINEADKTRQVANETLPKRKRKPITRFSPDFFAKQTDQTKSQLLEKDCNQTKSTVCESCFVLFKKTALLSKKECRRRFFDPITNKRLLLCNACGVRMARVVSGRPKKHVFKEAPTDNEKNEYKIENTKFTEILMSNFDDVDAVRLACPSSTPKLCRCIQSYITAKSQNCIQAVLSDASGSTGWKTRALELLHLYKEARRLRDQKSYFPGSKNMKRRSAEYEQFVFSTRERLKKELMICERGAQTLLIYSNNFLHKQLKTSPDMGPRIPRKPDLSSLVSVQNLVDVKCCKNRCTKLAVSHSKLLQNWRSRAKLSQKDARNVLAEMLIPSAGKSTNCHYFIRLVTGCSSGLLCKVNQKIRSSQGEREPAEHGLRKYWHKKKVHAAVLKGSKPIKEPTSIQPVGTTVIKSIHNQVSENTNCRLSAAEENQQLSPSVEMREDTNLHVNDNVKQATLVNSIFQNLESMKPVSTLNQTFEHSETIPVPCNNITDNINSNCIQYIPVSVIQSNTTKNISNLMSESDDLRYSSIEHCISEPLSEPPTSLENGISQIPLVVDNTTLQNGLITVPVVLQGQVEPLYASLPTSSESLNLQPTLLWTTSGLFLLSSTGTSTPGE